MRKDLTRPRVMSVLVLRMCCDSRVRRRQPLGLGIVSVDARPGSLRGSEDGLNAPYRRSKSSGKLRIGAGRRCDWGVMNRTRTTHVKRRRIATLGATLGALVIGVAFSAAPASAKPGNLAGSWVSVDIDGSNQTLRIKGAGNHVYAMFYRDDRTSGICGGTPAKVIGRGVADGNELAARGTLVCLPGGNPFPGQRITVTYHYHAGNDTLTDSSGVVWRRA